MDKKNDQNILISTEADTCTKKIENSAEKVTYIGALILTAGLPGKKIKLLI